MCDRTRLEALERLYELTPDKHTESSSLLRRTIQALQRSIDGLPDSEPTTTHQRAERASEAHSDDEINYTE